VVVDLMNKTIFDSHTVVVDNHNLVD